MKTAYKNEACVLRRRGVSLAGLSSRLGISKSTVSLWTKDVVLSELGTYRVEQNKIHHRDLGYAVLRQKKLGRLVYADEVAGDMLKKIDKNQSTALVALAMMYWCEGAKRDGGVAFTNSDPELVQAFLAVLADSFPIDRKKLRVCMHLHNYHVEEEMLHFWSTTTGIAASQFTKTFKKQSEHLYKKEGYKGCVRITYHDAHVARVLLSFAKKLIKLYI